MAKTRRQGPTRGAWLLAASLLSLACAAQVPMRPHAEPNDPRGLRAEPSSPRADPEAPPPSAFVSARGRALFLQGAPYRFVGVNMWYGAYLAAPGETGNRERLNRELDQLARLGVTNLRVLGASEAGPFRHSIKPTFRGSGRDYNEDLLRGLDTLLVQLGKRDMKAVIYLNNFWEWSGGMGTYLSWVNGGTFVDLGDPKKPWPAYPLFTMQFYGNRAANALYRDYVKAVVTRVNSVSGVAYRDDPSIMAWQLANEPRPGYKATPGNHALPEFYRFIEETAAFIKALDSNHMVSTGNEGLAGCADYESCFVEAHRSEHIDYLTFHLWPKNWGWLVEDDMAQTMERTLENSSAYIERHIEYAKTLDKPIVLEEFGLPRDRASLVPGSATTHRDRFLRKVFGRIELSVVEREPLVGSNVWTWGGSGRAARASGQWQDGDFDYTGDPPQEPQGYNSVFDVDATTLAIVQAHAAKLATHGIDTH